MEITINKQILSRANTDDAVSQTLLDASFVGKSSYATTTAGFKVRDVVTKTFQVLDTDTVTVDVDDLVNDRIGKATFISVYCQTEDEDRTPVRFQVAIQGSGGTATLGTMSNIDLVDIDTNSVVALTLSSFGVPASSTAILTVIVGLKEL